MKIDDWNRADKFLLRLVMVLILFGLIVLIGSIFIGSFAAGVCFAIVASLGITQVMTEKPRGKSTK